MKFRRAKRNSKIKTLYIIDFMSDNVFFSLIVSAAIFVLLFYIMRSRLRYAR